MMIRKAFGYVDSIRRPSHITRHKNVSILLKTVVHQPAAPLSLAVFAILKGSERDNLACLYSPPPAAVSTTSLMITGTLTIKNYNKNYQNLDTFFNNPPRERGLVMQLVSTQIDSRTMEANLSKPSILKLKDDDGFGAAESYTSSHDIEFEIDSNFGFPGAIIVTNKYDKEIFLEGFSIEGVVDITCNSWVQPVAADDQIVDHPDKRIFFSNKAYLPCDTPEGLKKLRKEELMQLRGNGKGVIRRRGSYACERVYEYDVYNDLGNPDKGNEYERPILGGTKDYPCPRRCRTGRPLALTDKKSESPKDADVETYVPRDEAYEGLRKRALDAEKLKGVTRNLIPFIKTCFIKCGDFKQPSDIQNIYRKTKQSHEMKLPNETRSRSTSSSFPMDHVTMIRDVMEEYFKFDTPYIISGNGCSIPDEELGRQALAGINPLSIKRLENFPPLSDLDPSIYGAQESNLQEEHIINHLDGMSIQQAMEEKKLFILDYHDAYLPFLNGINGYEDRKAYATRTIMYLTQIGTLKPIAIELSLSNGRASKQVLTPPLDANSYWLWQVAKAHVCSNDAGVHQLVHHWYALIQDPVPLKSK